MAGISYTMNQERSRAVSRNYSLDILRLLSMIMVTVLHFWGWGGLKNLPFSDGRFLISTSIYTLSKGAVLIFWIISAWFTDDDIRLHYRVKKLKKLYIKVWLYSVSLFFISIFCFDDKFNIIQLVKSIFPILSRQYWFITQYFLFYLITPYLKKLVLHLTNGELIALISIIKLYPILTGETCILDCLSTALIVFGIQRLWSGIDKYKAFGFGIMFVIFMLCSECVDFLTFKYSELNISRVLAIQDNFSLLGAISLFIFFIKINSKSKFSKILGKNFSGSVVAIYLITVHPTLKVHIYHYIYTHIPDNLLYFCGFFVFFTVVISFICIVLDWGISVLINKLSALLKNCIKRKNL